MHFRIHLDMEYLNEFKFQDHGQEISISVPLDFKPSESIKQAFVETSIINWSIKYMFAGVDRRVSRMILEISTVVKGNSTLDNPNNYYYLSQEDAASIEIK